MKIKFLIILIISSLGLINYSTAQQGTLKSININEGAGFFNIEGGIGHENDSITVYYHKPKNWNSESKILMVIPGTGRNGDDYRNSWIVTSEKHSVLILSPSYPESGYGLGDYHLCGLIGNSNLKNSVTYVESSNIAKLNEEQFSFEVNSNPNEWIFNDFDRIFESIKKMLNTTQTTYDIFGHSAGGHILHRLALFHKNSKANKILASNASFYTLPSFQYDFPFGLKNSPIEQELLKSTFKKELIVFLGELDNENETGGTFLRSKSADKQGLHRLERGNFFYQNAKEKAEELGCDFNWKIVIVPNVGHDYRKMGNAAGQYLYRPN